MGHIVNLIKKHEGLRLKPYRDSVGKLTIGYGRNLDDRGITRDEAEYMLNNDVSRCMAELRQNLPWFDRLDPVRQDVLIDMCFNLGIGSLLKFNQTLGHIEKAEYDLAADCMLDSLWAKQVGARAVELSFMMRTGTYKEDVR